MTLIPEAAVNSSRTRTHKLSQRGSWSKSPKRASRKSWARMKGGCWSFCSKSPRGDCGKNSETQSGDRSGPKIIFLVGL